MTSLRRVAKRVLPRPVVDWLRARFGSGAAKLSDEDRRPGILPEIGPSAERILELERGLWSTGESGYLVRLERSVRLTGRESSSRARSHLALARWDFHHGNIDMALERFVDVWPSDQRLRREVDLFRVDCLCALGKDEMALTVLSRMRGRSTTDHNLLLRLGRARSLLSQPANHGSGPVTEGLNAIYSNAGVAMIRRNSVFDPIGLGNLTCGVAGAEPAESLPLVTVVVLFPDSLPEGYAGISSLLAQSWRNLEIVVYGGPEIRDRLAADDAAALEDSRVLLMADDDGERQLVRGISHAGGEFVTTHLYGSWSHPQRVEAQARALLANPLLRAAVSSHIKVGSDLDPRPLGTVPRPDLVGPDPHSLMIRTSRLNPDGVVAAYDRVVASYSPLTGAMEPAEDVVVVNEGVPLTLTLAESSSVSRPTSQVASL